MYNKVQIAKMLVTLDGIVQEDKTIGMIHNDALAGICSAIWLNASLPLADIPLHVRLVFQIT